MKVMVLTREDLFGTGECRDRELVTLIGGYGEGRKFGRSCRGTEVTAGENMRRLAPLSGVIANVEQRGARSS
jgi:hypothetical protein